MIGFDEAIGLIDSSVRPLGSEIVALDRAAGRFLAENLHARGDSPRTDVSIMDGYALESEAVVAGEWYDIVGEARPGLPFTGETPPGTAVRVFTGAPLPSATDRVVMQEYAERESDRVRFMEVASPTRNVRMAGSDFRQGDLLAASGTRLHAPAMIPAAAADRSKLHVGRRPRVAIIATGDELVCPGEANRHGTALPETASYGISALCERMGGRVGKRLHGRDRRGELSRLAGEALESADCVVVIGGASVGDYDLAQTSFADARMERLFSKVAIKPGKPVWLGMVGEKPVIGLPGNPTSAMVAARLFLAPLLGKLQGGRVEETLELVPLLTATALPATDTREVFVRCQAANGGLIPVSNQQSGAQAPLAQSRWLIRRPASSPACPAGSIVHALPF